MRTQETNRESLTFEQGLCLGIIMRGEIGRAVTGQNPHITFPPTNVRQLDRELMRYFRQKYGPGGTATIPLFPGKIPLSAFKTASRIFKTLALDPNIETGD